MCSGARWKLECDKLDQQACALFYATNVSFVADILSTSTSPGSWLHNGLKVDNMMTGSEWLILWVPFGLVSAGTLWPCVTITILFHFFSLVSKHHIRQRESFLNDRWWLTAASRDWSIIIIWHIKVAFNTINDRVLSTGEHQQPCCWLEARICQVCPINPPLCNNQAINSWFSSFLTAHAPLCPQIRQNKTIPLLNTAV